MGLGGVRNVFWIAFALMAGGNIYFILHLQQEHPDARPAVAVPPRRVDDAPAPPPLPPVRAGPRRVQVALHSSRHEVSVTLDGLQVKH